MHCDRCEMVSINGIACHEHGCPNNGKRWSASADAFVRVYVCRECDSGHDTPEERDACCAPCDDEPAVRDALMHLFADSARGVYIPQHFAESVVRARVTGVSDEDYATLEAGPDSEAYWDTWSDVIDRASVTDTNGRTYFLYQDGDLWLIEAGAEWNEDSEVSDQNWIIKE